MDRHDIDAELSVPGARELIESTSAAHLAYVATDGTPRVIPVGFFWTGDEFVISTATTAPKVEALAAHPNVALAIDAGNTPGGARLLSVRGRADVQIVDGVWAYLTAEEATTLYEALHFYFQDDARDPEWHHHVGQPGGPELTIAIGV